MPPVVFVTGGARSGKSRFAQSRVETEEGALLYVATAGIGDTEMTERVRLHREARGERWRTLEEPLDLAGRMPEAVSGVDGILVDCVTLWVTNLLFHYNEDAAAVLAEVDRFIATFPFIVPPLVLVSNEVGYGIVPENRLARLFRDLAGEANQRLAAAADEAYLVAAGLPLRLK